MRILGFGDSFISPNDLDYTYTTLVGKHFNTTFECHGRPGSGAWDAFFHFLDRREKGDVIIFVWSAEHRLYHPHYTNICPAGIEQNLKSDNPVWEAADLYYKHLYDARKSFFEHLAFYQYVDKHLSTYHSDSKIIHMWGFPSGNTYNAQGQSEIPRYFEWHEAEKFNYIHRFNHGVEIRPALINLSYRDEWPGDLGKETRVHHLTDRMHEHLANYIIDAIENYESGKLITVS